MKKPLLTLAAIPLLVFGDASSIVKTPESVLNDGSIRAMGIIRKQDPFYGRYEFLELAYVVKSATGAQETGVCLVPIYREFSDGLTNTYTSVASVTRDVPDVTTEWDEMKSRVDAIWTDHTNRMARIERMRNRRKGTASAPKPNIPPTSPLRFVPPSRSGRRAK